MRAIALIVVASAAALGGCAKKDEKAAENAGAAPAAESRAPAQTEVKMPAGFPKMTASYRGEYTGEWNGSERAMTMEVAGWKRLRMEMPHMNAAKAAKGDTMVMVMDDASKRWLMYVQGPDAPKAAMVMTTDETLLNEFQKWGAEDGAPPVKVGSDKVAGLSCDIWESAGDGDAPKQACVTRDGIFLWAKDKGAEKPDIVATKVERGSIDASRFALPAGFEVIDMGPCIKMGQEMATAARKGERLDMSKMQACQAIGQKASAIMGEMR